MQITVREWILQRIPHYEGDSGTCLRWTNRQGNIQETALDYVTDRFGPTIYAALVGDGDVVEAIQAGPFDDAWKDIWALWREYEWV